MDRSIAESLKSLLPALSGPLPPELVDLAISLLAQSRGKASSLKENEEIARSYACANIACERLRQSLTLPKIQPCPPCPPKVYQKLYRYLDSALPTATRRSGRHGGNTSKNVGTPTKVATPFRRIPTRPVTSTKKLPPTPAASQTPAWVMPVIRRLCKKLGAPSAPHHTFAGVSSILTARALDGRSASGFNIKIPALIIAVFFIVTTRLAGVLTPPEEYLRQKMLALAMLEEIPMDLDRETVTSDDVDMCMRQFRDEPWREMDWFRNVEPGSGVTHQEGEDAAEGASEDEEAIDGQLLPVKRHRMSRMASSDEDYLRAGLGTMMHDAVDYLSDERRHDYRKWKDDILQRIEVLAKDPGQERGSAAE